MWTAGTSSSTILPAAVNFQREPVYQRVSAPSRTLHKTPTMAWTLLFFAGLFEIGWAVGLKFTAGFSRFWPSLGTALSMIASVVLLGLAVRELPVGSAYAVWTGIGAVGTVVLGIVLFGEPASALRLLSIALILLGIIGLKLSA
jgi:quaternary ammonium compound-resistance protein SugE